MEMPRALKFFVSRMIAGGAVLIGAGLLGAGLFEIAAGSRSVSWPTAEGVVVSSSVTGIVQDGASRGGSRGVAGFANWSPRVRYQYEVGGASHVGSRVAIGESVLSYKASASIASRYPVGTGVKVYYDPRDASVSLLEPGVSGRACIQPAFGGLVLLVGVVMSVYLPRSFDQSQL